MADEEGDYLSDNFITNVASDVRPGLQLGFARKRQHEMAKRCAEANKKSRTKPVRVLEEEKREQGLGEALTPSNRGFALLQKMGYKPGMTIGKTEEGGASAVRRLEEPIRPVVKNNRLGLGQEAQQKREVEERVSRLQEQHMERVRSSRQLSADFQDRIRWKRRAKRISGDLWKSQKVCLDLDTQANLECASEEWFWPEQAQGDLDSCSSSSEEQTEEEILETKSGQLEMLTVYLRKTYFYCLWCGVRYDDEVDLGDNCPGSTAEDHE